MGVPHKSNSFSFFFAMSQFDWPITKKKLKLWRLPKIEDSMERWSASPFGPPIELRSGGLWANHRGLKRGAIGNTLVEHIGNLMGTHWEQRENEKNSSPPPHPNPKLKRKRVKALWVHAEPSHWLHEISISRTVHHHFWPWIACIINWGYLLVVKIWERNGFHGQYPWRTNCGRTRHLDSATPENHYLHFQNVPILFPTNRGSKRTSKKNNLKFYSSFLSHSYHHEKLIFWC